MKKSVLMFATVFLLIGCEEDKSSRKNEPEKPNPHSREVVRDGSEKSKEPIDEIESATAVYFNLQNGCSDNQPALVSRIYTVDGKQYQMTKVIFETDVFDGGDLIETTLFRRAGDPSTEVWEKVDSSLDILSNTGSSWGAPTFVTLRRSVDNRNQFVLDNSERLQLFPRSEEVTAAKAFDIENIDQSDLKFREMCELIENWGDYYYLLNHSSGLYGLTNEKYNWQLEAKGTFESQGRESEVMWVDLEISREGRYRLRVYSLYDLAEEQNKSFEREFSSVIEGSVEMDATGLVLAGLGKIAREDGTFVLSIEKDIVVRTETGDERIRSSIQNLILAPKMNRKLDWFVEQRVNQLW